MTDAELDLVPLEQLAAALLRRVMSAGQTRGHMSAPVSAVPPVDTDQLEQRRARWRRSSTGACTLYWQHVANLVEKGYAEIGYAEIDGAGSDFVTITDAGAARALLEIEREGNQ